MTSSSFADSDGVRIHCLDFGGNGPDILLVHATGFHARTWEPIVDQLTDSYRVTAMDVRGHGLSDKPDTDYRWGNFSADVLAVVDHLQLESPLGVGHSSGGTALVLSTELRPAFSKLVLLDPVMPPRFWKPESSEHAVTLVSSTRKRRNQWDSPDQFYERMSSARSPFANWRPDILHAYTDHGLRRVDGGGYELACPPEVEARIYEGNVHEGRRVLKHIGIPTLLLMFADSYLWPEGNFNLGDNPNITNLVLPGGHFAPQEQPDTVWSAVIDWMESS